MAIALDTSTTSTAATFSHTCTGSNLILFVGVNGDLTDTLTGITYAGVSMTLVRKVQVPGDRWDYLYYLLNPATGANNVVVSGASFHANAAVSYTGVKQSGQPDSSNTNTNTSSASITFSTTVVAANSWLVMWGSVTAGTMSAGTGTTFRNGSQAGGYSMYDSNGTVGTGSQSLIFNNGSSGTNGGIIASFAPVNAAGIVFDSSGASTNGNATTTASYTHTCSGTNRFLVAAVWNESGAAADNVTSVTYNGVSMTLLDQSYTTGQYGLDIYYLANPASGANTLLATRSSSVNGFVVMGASYTGVAQIGSILDHQITRTAGTLTGSTGSTASCWSVIAAAGSGNITASTGTRFRNGGPSPNTQGFIGDSDGTIATGSYSMAISGLNQGAQGMFSLAPASAVNSSFLAFM